MHHFVKGAAPEEGADPVRDGVLTFEQRMCSSKWPSVGTPPFPELPQRGPKPRSSVVQGFNRRICPQRCLLASAPRTSRFDQAACADARSGEGILAARRTWGAAAGCETMAEAGRQGSRPKSIVPRAGDELFHARLERLVHPLPEALRRPRTFSQWRRFISSAS